MIFSRVGRDSISFFQYSDEKPYCKAREHAATPHDRQPVQNFRRKAKAQLICSHCGSPRQKAAAMCDNVFIVQCDHVISFVHYSFFLVRCCVGGIYNHYLLLLSFVLDISYFTTMDRRRLLSHRPIACQFRNSIHTALATAFFLERRVVKAKVSSFLLEEMHYYIM